MEHKIPYMIDKRIKLSGFPSKRPSISKNKVSIFTMTIERKRVCVKNFYLHFFWSETI
jgi:hypothetical protein